MKKWLWMVSLLIPFSLIAEEVEDFDETDELVMTQSAIWIVDSINELNDFNAGKDYFRAVHFNQTPSVGITHEHTQFQPQINILGRPVHFKNLTQQMIPTRYNPPYVEAKRNQLNMMVMPPQPAQGADSIFTGIEVWMKYPENRLDSASYTFKFTRLDRIEAAHFILKLPYNMPDKYYKSYYAVTEQFERTISINPREKELFFIKLQEKKVKMKQMQYPRWMVACFGEDAWVTRCFGEEEEIEVYRYTYWAFSAQPATIKNEDEVRQ